MANESPAGARRRVRLALREAREAADLTQGQVAEAMEWSLSKVMRIESGEVTISPNDLRPLLAHLGIGDGAVVEQLVQDSRTSRRRRLWWDDPRLRDHLTQSMREIIQYESEATAIRQLHTMIIPGRLQTPDYATAILNSYRGEMSDVDIEVRLEVRLRRRAELLNRRDVPEMFLLLDESVLKRRVGGAHVMGEQLLDLLKISHEKRLAIRVVPYAIDAPLPLLGAYEILNLAGDDDNAVLYRESHLTDEIVDDRSKVARHRRIFERLWSAALDEATTAELIENSAKSVLDDALPTGQSKARTRSARSSHRRGSPG